MPLDLNLLRSRPLALLVFAAAAVGQPWPADVTGCREGFYLASPAAAEGCTACPEVPQAIAVTCTGPDDSIATACQDTYHLKDDGSCAFDEAQEIAARILLGVFVAALVGGMCFCSCDVWRREYHRTRIEQARVLEKMTRGSGGPTAQTDDVVRLAAQKLIAPVREIRQATNAVDNPAQLKRWRSAAP
jgi:hypothetical protein